MAAPVFEDNTEDTKDHLQFASYSSICLVDCSEPLYDFVINFCSCNSTFNTSLVAGQLTFSTYIISIHFYIHMHTVNR